MLRKAAIRLGVTAMLLAPGATAMGQTGAQSAADRAASLARRGGGFRVAEWKTETIRAPGGTYAGSPAFEAYFQRGIDTHVTIESSAGIWRRRSVVPQNTAGLVTTKSYVIPIVSTIKAYPFTGPKVLVEPYLLAGGGFAIGFDNVSTNAIGGGGKSTAAGFGFKAAAGIEFHATHTFGLSVAWRYESVKFGDHIGGQQAYSGAGIEAGLTYHPKGS